MGITNCCKRKDPLNASSFSTSIKLTPVPDPDENMVPAPNETFAVGEQESIPQNEHETRKVKQFAVSSGYVETNKGAVQCAVREYMQSAAIENALRKKEPNNYFGTPKAKRRSTSAEIWERRSHLATVKTMKGKKGNHNGYPKTLYKGVKPKYMEKVYPQNYQPGVLVNFTSSIPTGPILERIAAIKPSPERSCESHSREDRSINIILNKNLLKSSRRTSRAISTAKRGSIGERVVIENRTRGSAVVSSTLSLSNSFSQMKQVKESPTRLSLKLRELMEKAVVE